MTTFQSVERKGFVLLERYRKHGGLCDFTFNANGVRISAHKIVLVATIPFFRDLFLGGEQCVEFPELKQHPGELIDAIISFAYTERIKITEENLGDLLKAAKTLRMDSLRTKCAEYISSRLSPNAIHGTMELARNLAMEDVAEACIQSIANSFNACIDKEVICRLGDEEFCSLMARSDLRIKDEVSLHRAIVCWLEYRSTERAVRSTKWNDFARLASYPRLFGLICSLFLRADRAVQFMHTPHELTFRLSTENIVPYLRIAEELEFADVTALIEWALCKNFEEFAATREFCTLPCSQIKHLLMRDDLAVANEVTVFNSLVTWLNAQKLDKPANQSMLEELFALIRLLQVPSSCLPRMLSEHSECSTSTRCRGLIQKAQQVTGASPTSILTPEEASTATFSRKPRLYRDSGKPVLFVLSTLLRGREPLRLLTYEMKKDSWKAAARLDWGEDGPVVGFLDSIYAFSRYPCTSGWQVQIVQPATGELRQGSAAPTGTSCSHAIVFDKKIFLASTTKCSSLYDPLSETWSSGPEMKPDLPISGLISVRERHVVALCTKTPKIKAFCWSPVLVQPDAGGEAVLGGTWSEMPFPNEQHSDVAGVELNGRLFVGGFWSLGEKMGMAMFISVNDAHPDAWEPEGQWTIISELSCCWYQFTMSLIAGDIYQIEKNDEDAAVFLPAVIDRRPGSSLHSSSDTPMSAWKWWPLAKYPNNTGERFGGVFLQSAA